MCIRFPPIDKENNIGTSQKTTIKFIVDAAKWVRPLSRFMWVAAWQGTVKPILSIVAVRESVEGCPLNQGCGASVVNIQHRR